MQHISGKSYTHLNEKALKGVPLIVLICQLGMLEEYHGNESQERTKLLYYP